MAGYDIVKEAVHTILCEHASAPSSGHRSTVT